MEQEHHADTARPHPERFYTDPHHGLTQEQAAKRKEQGLTNAQPTRLTKSFGRIVLENTFTLFNGLNLALAICVLLVGSYHNMLFMVIVLSNTIIATVQEIRSKITVDKLSIMNAPTATVLRDATPSNIALTDIVLDDVLLIGTGKQVCADAIVLEGFAEVDESLLTGESNAVRKQPGDLLLSGSFIVSGHVRARVEHVGEQNYSYQLKQEASRQEKQRSELMSALQKIIRFVSVIIFPVGILLFCKSYFLARHSLYMSVVSTVGALIGMIPEGLMLLTSVALAVGVIRLAQKRTLVQDIYCIETLARVDVLCLDKTGTITQGDMQVVDFVPLESQSPSGIQEVMSAYVRAVADESPTFLALTDYFSHHESSAAAKTVLPFSSERKYSAVTFENGTYILGACEFILPDDRPLLEKANAYAEQGLRVLLLGHSHQPLSPDDKAVSGEIRPLALILLVDKIREDAFDTLAFFQEQDVELKVISGDHPITASEVARRAGLAHAHRYIDTSALSEEELVQSAGDYTVFGRVTPQQKRTLIRSLQKEGHTVAMTGDGVNDILSLRDADCSIAMASGSDAARAVSHIVLLDSNFSAMPAVVMEGRRVINNIQRTASLFLIKTIYSFLLSLIFLFLPSVYPFTPIQLSLISTLVVGLPSFVLALEPDKSRVKGRFLVNVFDRAFPAALTVVANVLLVHLVARLAGLDMLNTSTLTLFSTAVICMIVLFQICMPLNLLRTILLSVVTLTMTAAFLFFGDLFSINVYDIDLLPLLIIISALAYPMLMFFKKLTQRFPIHKKILRLH
ncbi:MAG: cation-translocating P-type ATPase [Christensenellales bacterium]|jgi:cation-transporting ATPase E